MVIEDNLKNKLQNYFVFPKELGIKISNYVEESCGCPMFHSGMMGLLID
jgi:hypothetical protein